MVGRWCILFKLGLPPLAFTSRTGFNHPNTRTHVRLLGPCFKTGQLQAFRQHLGDIVQIKERLAAYPEIIYFLTPILLLPVTVYNSPDCSETYLPETLLQRIEAMLTCSLEKSPSHNNVRYLT